MHIIVHIGPPKTGTSAIQNAIFRNQEALLEQGLFAYRKRNARALFTLYGREKKALMPAMRRDFANFEEARRWSEESWHEFEAQVAETQPETVLISSEHFANLGDPTAFIARLQKTFDRITTIFYVRDPVDLYKSKIDQLIRGGVQFSSLETPAEYDYPGAERLDGYIKLLGKENVIVRNFARSNLRDGDVISDFFHTVSEIMGTSLSIPHMPPPINESLSAPATAWMLTMNETFVRMTTKDDRETLELRQELIQRLRSSESVKAFPKLKVQDPLFVDLIRWNARDTITWFNENFLTDQEPLKHSEQPQDIPPPREIRHRMREWLLGYLTPEAVTAVSREVVLLNRAGARKKQQTWKKKREKERLKAQGGGKS